MNIAEIHFLWHLWIEYVSKFCMQVLHFISQVPIGEAVAYIFFPPKFHAPFGESCWALLPAGSSSSMPLQHILRLPWAVLSVGRGRYSFKWMHMKGWNSLSWCQATSSGCFKCRESGLTLRPYGPSGSSLRHEYRVHLTGGSNIFSLLEFTLKFTYTVHEALWQNCRLKSNQMTRAIKDWEPK